MSSPTELDIPSISVIQSRLKALKIKRDTLLTKASPSTPMSQSDINELKDIYSQQLELYNLVNDLNSTFQNVLNSSQTLNVHQKSLQSQLSNINSDLTDQLNKINDKQVDKVQQAKINRYFSDKYENQTQLLKVIVVMLSAIILLAFLRNNEFIMNDAFNVLVIIILIIGGILLLKQMVDILRRSNTDYQEIKWKFIVPEIIAAVTPSI